MIEPRPKVTLRGLRYSLTAPMIRKGLSLPPFGGITANMTVMFQQVRKVEVHCENLQGLCIWTP